MIETNGKHAFCCNLFINNHVITLCEFQDKNKNTYFYPFALLLNK